MSETPLESAPEDVAEQSTEVLPDDPDLPDLAPPGETSLEVDPADAQEQATPVPIDEDDWP
jgi:hypothetical protein